MKCKCGNQIPDIRLKLGYAECVNCSQVERVGCVDIIHHKTGNEIQICDRETAEKMHQLSRRTGFGTLRGMKPGRKSESYNPIGKGSASNLTARAIIADPQKLEDTGAQAWDILEEKGWEATIEWLHQRVEDLWITPVQMGKIRVILSTMTKREPEPMLEKRSWYSKIEPKQGKPDVDSDITDIFKYWKK